MRNPQHQLACTPHTSCSQHVAAWKLNTAADLHRM
jgi:hypothetical protein